LAILSAASFGAGDFLGGLATRRSSPLRVVGVSQLYGFALIASLLAVFPPEDYGLADFGWGAAAGVCGGTGLVFLYRGLSRSRMGVVAPIAGGVGAMVPAVFGLISGERPSSVALIGVVVALAAIVVVGWPTRTTQPDSALQPAGTLEAIAAGLAFGAFFIFLSRAADTSGVWPLVAARIGSLALIWSLLVGLSGTVSVRHETNLLVLGAGVLDTVANALFLYAARSGLITLVAVLSSLYPAATVLLARLVLRERLSRLQIGGVALTLLGMALIAAG
jgi:drug/metabolite transporter (DMT)-like permease